MAVMSPLVTLLTSSISPNVYGRMLNVTLLMHTAQ
jgi:hypothetical protein